MRMGLLVILCASLCLAFSPSPPEKEVERLPYSPEKPLTWDDFVRRVKVPLPGYKAYTWSGIAISIETGENGVHIDVNSYFAKGESWVEKGAESPELLRHEQGHFDLTELHTRRLKKLLLPYQNMDVPTFVREAGQDNVQALYDRVFQEMNAEQERYDRETEHSIHTSNQALWNADLARRLSETQ